MKAVFLNSDFCWRGLPSIHFSTIFGYTLADAHFRPIDVSSLLPDRHLSIAFVIRLLKDILKTTQKPVGTLKGTKYIPHVFEEAKKSALIERLKRDTILGINSRPNNTFRCCKISW